MPKLRFAATIDATLLRQVDEMVRRRRFANRSQAVERALTETLRRLARSRLARACARLDPGEEKALAEDGLARRVRSLSENAGDLTVPIP